MSKSSFVDKSSVLTILTVVVILAIIVLSFPTRELVVLASDDGFYYLKVAENIAFGRGSTFDGINLTNGYHPLWLGILIPIGRFIGYDSDIYFRITLLLQYFIFGATLFIYWRVVRRAFQPLISFLAVVAFLWPRFFNINLSFVETSLVTILIVLALQVFVTTEERRARESQPWKLGFALALLLMARLDSLFVAATIILIVCLYEWRYRHSLRKALRATIPLWFPCFFTGSTYLFLNLLFFGHGLPISGALKTSFPYLSLKTPSVPPEIMSGVLVCVVTLMLVLLTPLGHRTWGKWNQLQQSYVKFSFFISIGALIHLIWTLLFMDWAVFNWHFVIEVFAIIAGIPILLDLTLTIVPRITHYPRIIISITLLTLVAANIYSLHQRYYLSANSVVYDAARYVAENTPADTRFAMKDSGIFGYFSNRRTVNLDGVINSFDYQIYLRDGMLTQFLTLNQISCLVQHAFIEGEAGYERNYLSVELLISSYLYETNYIITLYENDEIYRSPEYNFTETQRAKLLIFCPDNFNTRLATVLND